MNTPVKKWALQYVVALPVLCVFLAAVQYLKGHNLADALQFGLIWSTLSVAIFAIRRYVNFRKNIACMVCNDVAEKRETEA